MLCSFQLKTTQQISCSIISSYWHALLRVHQLFASSEQLLRTSSKTVPTKKTIGRGSWEGSILVLEDKIVGLKHKTSSKNCLPSHHAASKLANWKKTKSKASKTELHLGWRLILSVKLWYSQLQCICAHWVLCLRSLLLLKLLYFQLCENLSSLCTCLALTIIVTCRYCITLHWGSIQMKLRWIWWTHQGLVRLNQPTAIVHLSETWLCVSFSLNTAD